MPAFFSQRAVAHLVAGAGVVTDSVSVRGGSIKPDDAATGDRAVAGAGGRGVTDDSIGRLRRPSMKAPLSAATNTTSLTIPVLVIRHSLRPLGQRWREKAFENRVEYRDLVQPELTGVTSGAAVSGHKGTLNSVDRLPLGRSHGFQFNFVSHAVRAEAVIVLVETVAEDSVEIGESLRPEH